MHAHEPVLCSDSSVCLPHRLHLCLRLRLRLRLRQRWSLFELLPERQSDWTQPTMEAYLQSWVGAVVSWFARALRSPSRQLF